MGFEWLSGATPLGPPVNVGNTVSDPKEIELCICRYSLNFQGNGHEIFFAIVLRMNVILRHKKNFYENLF